MPFTVSNLLSRNPIVDICIVSNIFTFPCGLSYHLYKCCWNIGRRDQADLGQCYDGCSVALADHGRFVFIFIHQQVAVHANYQCVAKGTRLMQEVQVTNVEHVEGSLRISYLILFHLIQWLRILFCYQQAPLVILAVCLY